MVDISDIPRILRRHIPLLLITPLVFAALALFYLALKAPVYRSSAELLVRPEGLQVLVNDPVSTANNQTLQGMDLDSQSFVILSAAVLNQVANNLNLDDSKNFFRPGIRDLLFGGSSSGSRSSTEARNATLDALREVVQVVRQGNSFVFQIHVSHPDPELTALIANEIAEVYIRETQSTRAAALSRASSTLSKQAEQLRARVEAADAAVEAYKARQGLISTAGGSVVDQQIEALNTQITSSRVELEQTKSLYEQLANLTLSDVEAGAIPQVAESSVLNSLRVQYAQATQQEAEAAATLGANHPTLRELRSQVASTRQQIGSELQRIKASVESQYEQAKSTLAALEKQSQYLQSQNTAQGKALIELRQLQSEADASRAIYDSFLKRAQELKELPELDTNTSRILSAAQVPIKPSGPKSVIVLAASLLFGFAVAASGVVGLEILKGPKASERMLISTTGAPVLASLTPPQSGKGLARTLPRWLTGRPRAHPDEETIARTRIAYTLRQSFLDNRPANILILSVGETGETSDFVRSVAVELHDMGEEVLFAHTTAATNAPPPAADPAQSPLASKSSRIGSLNHLSAKLSGNGNAEPKAGERSEPAARGRTLASYLKVEQIDPRRKYASSGDLDSANEDYLLVNAGNIDSSPMLPILLRHCDGILLVTAIGTTHSSELEHALAYLEPWRDRIIGHVVVKSA
ncbi:exopolysaccharide transport family protein [Roseibium aggregatum]|uniref:Exopolysaccharide polymerization/transport protein n=1 Tax=Roseibium aggregatum TaxID=187304 RepID=A0A939J268_9HYPH|nr:exopolysaccharide transport family protein [Roseibium aggregatum]MBN9668760.1 exopolysaccharide polymerization/transport protein [Roseibium aggregatum]